MKSLEEVEQIVKQRLSEKRFKHSISVKEKCIELAKLYDEDIEKAALVGMAHDIAKEISVEEKFEYCRENNIYVDEVEKENPELLHAKIGADIARKELGFSEDMVKAIEYHTTGKVGMDKFAKILFVADAIADDRNWDGIEEGRLLSRKNLDEAVLYFLESTISITQKRKMKLHQDSILLRDEYLKNKLKFNKK